MAIWEFFFFQFHFSSLYIAVYLDRNYGCDFTKNTTFFLKRLSKLKILDENGGIVVLAWDVQDSPPAWLPSLLELNSASSVVRSAE